jgi:holo-[acyl-carrier protein] synthase
VGVDLVELDRIERALARWQGRIVARLMRPEEAARLPPAGEARTRAFAEAVAVKEAASKALGTGWTRGVAWSDVELDRAAVLLHGGAAARARALSGRSTELVELWVRDGLAVAEVWLRA